MPDNALMQALLQRINVGQDDPDDGLDLMMNKVMGWKDNPRNIALDEATRQKRLDNTEHGVGTPPSPEAASIMQTWMPQGIGGNERTGHHSYYPKQYEDLKRMAEQNAAVQKLRDAFGRK